MHKFWVGFYKYLRLKLTESFFRLCIDEQAIQYPRLELQLLADRWGITLRTKKKTKSILFYNIYTISVATL